MKSPPGSSLILYPNPSPSPSPSPNPNPNPNPFGTNDLECFVKKLLLAKKQKDKVTPTLTPGRLHCELVSADRSEIAGDKFVVEFEIPW